jgi:hypothetical protein
VASRGCLASTNASVWGATVSRARVAQTVRNTAAEQHSISSTAPCVGVQEGIHELPRVAEPGRSVDHQRLQRTKTREQRSQQQIIIITRACNASDMQRRCGKRVVELSMVTAQHIITRASSRIRTCPQMRLSTYLPPSLSSLDQQYMVALHTNAAQSNGLLAVNSLLTVARSMTQQRTAAPT